MARTAAILHVAAFAAMLLSGCMQTKRAQPEPRLTVLEAEEAPSIPLPTAARTAVSTVSASDVPHITFVDARPSYEKQYYPGETDPHRWRDAVTVLPMESFQPGLQTLLKEELLNRLKSHTDYRAVRCTVTSFHVALDERLRSEEDLLYNYRQWDDERERQEEERQQRALRQEQQERENRAMRRQLGIPDSGGRQDDDDSFGEQIMDGVFHAAIVKPIQKQRLRRETQQRLAAAAQTLPFELTDHKLPGWNCQLDLLLEVTARDGNQKTERLTARVHREKNSGQTIHQQIQAIVQQAVQSLDSDDQMR